MWCYQEELTSYRSISRLSSLDVKLSDTTIQNNIETSRYKKLRNRDPRNSALFCR